MSTAYERHPEISDRPSGVRTDLPSLLLLAIASLAALLSLAVGVLLSYFAFPEPTMWRLTVVVGVLAGAVMPLRLMVVTAGRRARRMRDR